MLCMLAQKVDGEYPASYSDLLLVALKLERWAEARDPLLPPKHHHNWRIKYYPATDIGEFVSL